MRIGIDMRMAGTGEGIGRYVEETVIHLAKLDKINQYFLLAGKISNSQFLISPASPEASRGRAKQIFSLPPFGRSLRREIFTTNPNFQFVKVYSPYYSWAEQTKFIWELKKLQLDLVHFASFNAPILYPGRFVTTIHDVIHHLYPGKKKSRLFHRLAYRLVSSVSVKRSQRVIAVSESTKQDIVKTFKLAPEKVEVIYEGVDEIFKNRLDTLEIEQIKKKYQIKKPYLLLVGVWRQYKNLPRLAQAFDILKERYQRDYGLVLAGKIDPFYPEIREAIFAARNAKEIKALGFVADEDLAALYQGAKAFVLPSLVEGFGLIGLEAQASEIPVAASNIAVLREVLGKGAVYFDPEDPEDIAAKINEILADEEFANNLKASGKENVKKFSWEKAARRTLEIYNNAGKRN